MTTTKTEKITSLDSELAVLLSDYQVLYHKLRGYHWTITGPHFFELHAKFEQLYLDAAEKVDSIAERLAARGVRPPVTMKDVLGFARLKEDGGRPSADEMVRNVATDLTALNQSLRMLSGGATASGDTTTANLLDDMADGQEKTIWMLRAFAAS